MKKPTISIRTIGSSGWWGERVYISGYPVGPELPMDVGNESIKDWLDRGGYEAVGEHYCAHRCSGKA